MKESPGGTYKLVAVCSDELKEQTYRTLPAGVIKSNIVTVRRPAVESDKQSPSWYNAKFKKITPEPKSKGDLEPRDYNESRFGDSPLWRWRYSDIGDFTALNITPHCPQCKGQMAILESKIKEQRDNGDHLYRVIVGCDSGNHPGVTYGETTNFDGSDYPEIRSQIQHDLEHGGWVQKANREHTA